MTSRSDDTMWLCPKCKQYRWPEQMESHLEWHKNNLQGGTPEVPPASESGGQT
jgi:hypothetical protein